MALAAASATVPATSVAHVVGARFVLPASAASAAAGALSVVLIVMMMAASTKWSKVAPIGPVGLAVHEVLALATGESPLTHGLQLVILVAAATTIGKRALKRYIIQLLKERNDR